MRGLMRSLRRAIMPSYRQLASYKTAEFFAQSSFFHDSQNIACYLATREELDIGLIIQAIWRAGKHCYLPVVLPDKSLRFSLYQENDSLIPNPYGILETTSTAFIETADLDVVLVPLLAFDREGNRLGTGGGYYDRTFGSLKKIKPALIGVGFNIQEVEMIDAEAFDVPLRAVLTESGLKRF